MDDTSSACDGGSETRRLVGKRRQIAAFGEIGAISVGEHISSVLLVPLRNRDQFEFALFYLSIAGTRLYTCSW